VSCRWFPLRQRATHIARPDREVRHRLTAVCTTTTVVTSAGARCACIHDNRTSSRSCC
jgi:hypothetical protein